MKVYICEPQIMGITDSKTKEFAEYVCEEIGAYVSIQKITSENMLRRIVCELDEESLIVFFNNKKGNLSGAVSRFMESAIHKSAKIYPIAMEKDTRLPAKVVKIYQSFDVPVCLENRVLGSDNLKPAAQICARKIISICCPTCYSEKTRIFVSHKREDGEEFTAKLCDKFGILERSRRLFRDVVEVNAGDEAQDIIDEALYESDAFIFIHTPLSAKSDWIKKELKMAVLYDIPIIWIRVNKASTEELTIIPGDKPHLECDSTDFLDEKKLEHLVNSLEHMLIQIMMNHSLKIYDSLESFSDWAERRKIELNCIDATNQVYKIIFRDKQVNQYPRRDYIQYVQYYGRGIRQTDIEALKKYTKDMECDSVVLLSNRGNNERIGDNIFVNSFELHDNWWRRMTGDVLNCGKKKIILSGAFPECDVELYKNPLMEALKIFSQEIIKNGYILVFGSHPTFQKLIFEVAGEFSDNPKETLQMYISKYFEDKYSIEELQEHAAVYEIEVLGERNQSLTKMRDAMIAAEDVCAVICLGGKVKKDNPKERGVDEEIQIAQTKGVPVFLVGSVGGRASELAMECKTANNWEAMNRASTELNEEFLFSVNYRKLANSVCEMFKS